MAIALVITCNYDNFPDSKLNGCHRDGDNFIEALKLIEPELTVIRMSDNLPTHDPLYPSKIKIAKKLIEFVQLPHERSYLFLSGHGSYVKDYNMDERKIIKTTSSHLVMNQQSIGMDSGFVTNEVKKLDILIDDDIYKILSMANKKKTIYCFADCCHSGTIMDLKYLNMLALKKRFTSNDIDNILNSNNKNKYTIIKSAYDIKTINANVYLFSGCRDNQFAYEDASPGEVQGIFTTHLCKILKHNKLNTLTYQQIYVAICGLINNQNQIPIFSTSQDIRPDVEMPFSFIKVKGYVKTIKGKLLALSKVKGFRVSKQTNTINSNEQTKSVIITQEQEIKEPEIKEPEIKEPETQEPEIKEPETQEPEIQEQEIQEPEIKEPETQEPEIKEPETQEPEIKEPETQEPEIQEPEIQEPVTQ
jgi:hypothetical protein